MIRRALPLNVILAVLAASLAVHAASDPAAQIRDIHGPLPFSGLPPFAATVLTLIVVLLAAWIRLTPRRRRVSQASRLPEERPLADMLTALEVEFRHGNLPVWLLFEHFTSLMRRCLAEKTATADLQLTSEELLCRVRKIMPDRVSDRAADLLALSDHVRFGALEPDRPAIDRAFSEARLLLEELSAVST